MARSDALTLRQLRALIAVVETGGITAAAKRLNVTAPAVSTQLRALEEQLGLPLVERPEFVPTDAGLELISAAQRVEMALARSLDRIESLRTGAAGRVILGATSTSKYFAPTLIAKIAEVLPDVRCQLVIGNRSEIISALDVGKLDFAIMGRPPRRPFVDARVLGSHPHIWLARPDHPLAKQANIEPLRLFEQAILTREVGSGTRILMERMLGHASPSEAFASIEFNSNETIKQAVMAGLGIAFLSAHTAVHELEGHRLAMLDVVGTPVIRNWFLLNLAGEPLTGAAKEVADLIVSFNGTFLPDVSDLIQPRHTETPQLS